MAWQRPAIHTALWRAHRQASSLADNPVVLSAKHWTVGFKRGSAPSPARSYQTHAARLRPAGLAASAHASGGHDSASATSPAPCSQHRIPAANATWHHRTHDCILHQGDADNLQYLTASSMTSPASVRSPSDSARAHTLHPKTEQEGLDSPPALLGTSPGGCPSLRTPLWDCTAGWAAPGRLGCSAASSRRVLRTRAGPLQRRCSL